MSLSKVQAESIDLTATYAFSGTVSDTAARNLVLLQTLTASSSNNLTFDTGIDNTYQSYVFKFINIHPQTDNAGFTVNFRDGGSNYDATKTTTYFYSVHTEDNSEAALGYNPNIDVHQGTGVATLATGMGSDNDQGTSGEMTLYDPSSTTFVKHFSSIVNSCERENNSNQVFASGYCNVTAAIDGVQFAASSGNIDSGTIKLYGIL